MHLVLTTLDFEALIAHHIVCAVLCNGPGLSPGRPLWSLF